MTGLIDLTGQVFGRLTAIRDTGKRIWYSHGSHIIYECLCECGSVVEVRRHLLLCGHTRSCGCLKTGLKRHRKTVHGHARNGNRTPEYTSWYQMIQRCTNPNNNHYRNYGGRGISVHHTWVGQGGFERFIKYMGIKPTPKHTLDRYPDNDGNYEPGNVRWATRQEQQRNNRRNVMLTHNGETRCLADWAETLGIKQGTVRARYRRLGSLSRALKLEK